MVMISLARDTPPTDLHSLRIRSDEVRRGLRHLYVQVPFCQHRCAFCAFVAPFESQILTQTALARDYVAAVTAELDWRAAVDRPIRTFMLGGGTPTVLEALEVATIVRQATRSFGSLSQALMAFETTPELATLERLNALADLGFEHVSIGIQSFFQRDLDLLGRRVWAAEGKDAIRRAKTVGFRQVSIDLVCHFPGAQLEDFRENLKVAVDLGVDAIDIEQMNFKFAGGDRFRATAARRGYLSPSLQERVTVLDTAFRFLRDAGYDQHEGLLFGRPGFSYPYQQHKLGMRDEVLGFGPASISAYSDRFTVGPNSIRSYLAAPCAPHQEYQYGDFLHELFREHLRRDGRVARLDLETLLGLTLEQAVESSPEAKGLVDELLLQRLGRWTDDGFDVDDGCFTRVLALVA
jgi:oxygen-independent coproporphyrinogen III oxidase